MTKIKPKRSLATSLQERYGWLLRGPARWLLLSGLALAAAFFGGKTLWELVAPRVLQNPIYEVQAENIVITPTPDWIRTDITREVLRDGGLDTPLDILDDTLAAELATAFELHPWVAAVREVRKRAPNRIEVDLVYRRPVLMVEVPGGLYPVDSQGVLLPSGDFSPSEAASYPRLAGIRVTTAGPVGTPWRDQRVLGAALIAEVLAEQWERMQLARLLPAEEGETADPQRPSFAVYTHRGTRIIWGHAPGEEAGSEPAAEAKLQRLLGFVAEKGSLDAAGVIDLRTAEVARMPGG